MPPIQQQSSRAGLISAVVILTILLIGCIFWAFYENTQFTKVDQDLTRLTAKYKTVIRDVDLTPGGGNENDVLTQFKKDYNNPNATLIDAAAQERRELFNLIKGSDEVNVKAGIDAAKAAVAQTIGTLHAAKLTDLDVNQPLPLVSTIQAMGSSLSAKQVAVDDALKARDAAVAGAAQAAAAQVEALKQRDASVAHEKERADAEEAKAKALNDTLEGRVTTITTDTKAQIDAANQKVQELQAQVAQLAGTIKTKDVEIKKIRGQYAALRPTNAKEVMIRHSGVHILRVENATTVYVDAGFNDRVNAGLTFEVYGKGDGIPKLGDGMSDENLPEGKASLEVVKVGENSSEARVVKTRPGETITQGDICCNITYDRNVKPIFVVYGNFDMDFNGVWTAAEADQVKAIVKRFGGVVGDKISIETDFLVLGKEPEVPQLTADEKNDPIMIQKVDKAKADLKAYEDVRNEAAEFGIPVLNQNRFLFYTGYFDLAKR